MSSIREHQQTIIELAEHIIEMGDGKDHCAIAIRDAAVAALATLAKVEALLVAAPVSKFCSCKTCSGIHSALALLVPDPLVPRLDANPNTKEDA